MDNEIERANNDEESIDNNGLFRPSTPPDRWRYVFCLFVLLGISGLLPWNLFITAHQYFYDKFGAGNDTSANYLRESFENYFVLTGSLFAFAGNVLNVFLTQRLTGDSRIILGHMLVIGSIIPNFVFSFLDTTQWNVAFFVFTLLLIIVGQIGCSGFICGGSAGLAVLFAPSYTKAFITGQAVCGVLTSLISIISLAIGSGSNSQAGSIYFGISIVFTIFSLIVYLPSRNNEFFKFYFVARERSRRHSINDDETDEENFQPLLGDTASSIKIRRFSQTLLKKVFRKTSYYGSMMTLVFIVTLSCFPALTSKVVTLSEDLSWKKNFIPILCFLNVNFYDFVGRLVSSGVYWPRRRNRFLLTMVCLIRICFIPLFLLCNFSAEKRYFPTVFESDWWFGSFACLLGFTNGYLCNLLCVYLPEGLGAEEKEMAGASISLYINLGVFLGSCLSFAVILLV